jgi:hypothetical protein
MWFHQVLAHCNNPLHIQLNIFLTILAHGVDIATHVTFEADTRVDRGANMASVREGGNLRISCTSIATPIPTISWTFNGQVTHLDRIYTSLDPKVTTEGHRIISVTPGRVNSILLVMNIQYPTDAGVYTCTGSTHHGKKRTSSATLSVEVLGRCISCIKMLC